MGCYVHFLLKQSSQDYERDVQDLFQRNSPPPPSHRDSFQDKMDDLSAETETAFLIEKTNHQSFVSVLVGVVLTGET